MILAVTDQFVGDSALVHQALTTVSSLRDGYERAYYSGIVHERRAKALLAHASPRAGSHAYQRLRRAMDCFDTADGLRPPHNDDARLRWNACARFD